MTTSFAMQEKVKAILGLRSVSVSNAIKIKFAVQPGYFDDMVEYCRFINAIFIESQLFIFLFSFNIP